jgi:hypothetical protein
VALPSVLRFSTRTLRLPGASRPPPPARRLRALRAVHGSRGSGLLASSGTGSDLARAALDPAMMASKLHGGASAALLWDTNLPRSTDATPILNSAP